MGKVSDQLRNNIWERRFHTYWRARYHGELAAKRTRLFARRLMTGCVLAVGSPYLYLIGMDWASLLVGLLGAGLAFYTLSEGQKDSVDSMMRSLQLSHLNTEWNDLWARVDSDDAEIDYLRNRYRQLSKRSVDVTASSMPEEIDEDLRIKVYDESAGYFTLSEEKHLAPT